MKHPRTVSFSIFPTTCLAFSTSGSLAQEWDSKPEHLSVEKSAGETVLLEINAARNMAARS